MISFTRGKYTPEALVRSIRSEVTDHKGSVMAFVNFLEALGDLMASPIEVSLLKHSNNFKNAALIEAQQDASSIDKISATFAISLTIEVRNKTAWRKVDLTILGKPEMAIKALSRVGKSHDVNTPNLAEQFLAFPLT